MKIYKQDIKDKKKENFMQRSRVLLASKGLLMSDKTLEVLYWVLFYSLEFPLANKDKTFKNMNQMHIAIAKEMGVYSSYIGAYINDRLISNKLITRTMSIPSDRFSRARIEKYDVPAWLESVYNSDNFKMELTFSYE
jgi:hypothetical protein